MGRETRKVSAAKQKRDGVYGAILLVPHVVLNTAAYLTLSGRATKLLYDIAMQYNLRNNGTLLASWRYMKKNRGWTSKDLLNKALKELVEHDLICQTVQGRMPNKASWYGLTWLALDTNRDMEISTQSWPRGSYALWKQPAEAKRKRKPPLRKNTTSCP
ncbi:MAG: hypothetical protein WAW02_14470 [Sideroxyarcus sp.]